MSILDLAIQNLLSPVVLFFALGLAAALAKSDLSVPEPVTKLLVLYLMMAIGFKGGSELSHHGVDIKLVLTLFTGLLLSFATPFAAFGLLRAVTGLPRIEAAAVAGHYGSISAVTFAAITAALTRMNIGFEGYMAAVAAAMETPAIISALMIAKRDEDPANAKQRQPLLPTHLLREVMLNGSIVMLVGAFVIGAITGARGMASLKPFIVDPWTGVLCLFLLDMGLVAGRGLEQGRRYLTPATCAFAIVMPLFGAAAAAVLAKAIGLSTGGMAVLMTLAASASYIAVPAAMRIALPQANPAIALTMSLCITFPFNLILGIPLYTAIANALTR